VDFVFFSLWLQAVFVKLHCDMEPLNFLLQKMDTQITVCLT